MSFRKPSSVVEKAMYVRILDAAENSNSVCWPSNWEDIVYEEEFPLEDKSSYMKFAQTCNGNMIKNMKQMIANLEKIQEELVEMNK